MGYEPQRITAPDGTALVVITAAEYDLLIAAQEDLVDITEAEAILSDIENGAGTIPSEVLFPIIEKGVSPIKAWRDYRGMTQEALARAAGISQVWVGRIEKGVGYGTAKVRQALALALDAPDWSLDLGAGHRNEDEIPGATAADEAVSYPSKSAHIRDLLARGMTRSEVAKRVGVRYQFVRNVDIATAKG